MSTSNSAYADVCIHTHTCAATSHTQTTLTRIHTQQKSTQVISGPGEMAQLLRTLAELVQDQSSVPRILVYLFTLPITSTPRHQM